MTDPIVLQRCDQFVGRTTNWLYDHLRFVPRYVPVILCDRLVNRTEFPALEARCLWHENFSRRLWHRIAGGRLYPTDLWWLRGRTPRVLHSHFGDVAGSDLTLQRILNAPWVVSFYGADLYQLGRLPEWQQIYAQIFDQAARIMALGPVMAAHLEKLGCPVEKLTVHPLGVDVEGLPSRPRQIKPGEPLGILFAGTFREKKGVRYVIEAAALIQRAGIRFMLHLVGDNAEKPGDRETKEAIFRQIRSLDLQDVIVHHSFLTFQELIDLALRLHVFVAPSVTAGDGDAEGTPFVLQQMMATGMPVVSTRHSDIPYLFGGHQHLLVPERDAKAIASRLEEYANDPHTLLEHGMHLRERMGKAFEVRTCAAALSDLYDEVQ